MWIVPQAPGDLSARVQAAWAAVLRGGVLPDAERDTLARVQASIESLVHEYLDPRGVIGYDNASTTTSVLLSCVSRHTARQRVVHRLSALVAAITSGGTDAITAWSTGGVAAAAADSADGASKPLLAPASAQLATQAAAAIMQLATPHTVLCSRVKLPDSLVCAYVDDQEHFDLSALASNLRHPRPAPLTADATESIAGIDIGAAVDVCVNG